MLRYLLTLLVATMIFACGTEVPPQPEEVLQKTRISLIDRTGLADATAMLREQGLLQAKVRLHYVSHETEIEVGLTQGGAAEQIRRAEKDRLAFLLSNFNANDPHEALVHQHLMQDMSDLEARISPQVRWAEVEGHYDMENALIADVVHISRSKLQVKESAHLSFLITDWTGDAWYVPAGGTSTVGTSGTLQKFWLDSNAKNALNQVQDGLEIDTLIKERAHATCGSSVSSNLPDYYSDTEFMDGPDFRNCTVGTITANALYASTLYWTWYPFASFNSSANPRIDIQYQPSKWCWWITGKGDCAIDPAWCMCSRNDLPIEWLIRYNYNEAPSVETSWVKN